MREDFKDAEQEPVPAPIDLHGKQALVNLREPVIVKPLPNKAKLSLRKSFNKRTNTSAFNFSNMFSHSERNLVKNKNNPKLHKAKTIRSSKVDR